MEGWRLELGAQVLPGDGVSFRVWAPDAAEVSVEVYRAGGRWLRPPRRVPMTPEGDGVYSTVVPRIGAGAWYKFVLDGRAFPDPYTRRQPEGVHGPSEVVDPSRFRWRDADWPGLPSEGNVFYECHVGTFTRAGTFAALARQLPALKRLGVTAIELMPVAETPGRRNWGYDGVDLFAPALAYGGSEGLRRLVDRAHRLGLGVILDVVYNHLGPSGNYLGAYARDYFSDRHHTPWGDALNYDGRNCRWVRYLAVANICHWITEYHIDGFRLDATHRILDESPVHLLREIAETARRVAEKPVLIIAEDNSNDVRLIDPPDRGGYGLDGVWADDFHHALRVRLTGERYGYYQDYRGTLAEIATCLNEGFLYQGARSAYRRAPRGTPVTDQPASRFIFCIENHDQVGNRAFGERLCHLVPAAAYRVASALLLLAPETPLLFMGQEFAASTPFLFFTDHEPELGRQVTAGRRNEFRDFPAFRAPAARARIPDPQAETTFLASKLDLGERRRHRPVYRLYQDLLRLRRSDPVLSRCDRRRTWAETLGADLLVMQRGAGEERRLVLATFGAAADLDLARFGAGGWRLRWWSEQRRYGGSGQRPSLRRQRVGLPAWSVCVLAAEAG